MNKLSKLRLQSVAMGHRFQRAGGRCGVRARFPSSLFFIVFSGLSGYRRARPCRNRSVEKGFRISSVEGAVVPTRVPSSPGFQYLLKGLTAAPVHEAARTRGGPASFWIALAFSMTLFLADSTVFAANQIQRILPKAIEPGSPFTVTNLVSAASHILAYAVEESVPTGWGVSQINLGGSVDLATGKIKWGPFFDHQPRSLTYRLRAPSESRGEFLLSGAGSFDGFSIPISGDSRLIIDRSAGSEDRNEVISSLSAYFVPGTPLLLTNSVLLDSETIAYAVEDSVPEGWTVGSLNQGGTFDAALRRIKWGPYLDRVGRELVAELTPSTTSTGLMAFSGIGSFDGLEIPIVGDRETRALLGEVVSEMPATYQANEEITINLVVTPTHSALAFAVEDHPPAGWLASNISHDGSFDPTLRTVKFGPVFTNGTTTLSYVVTPPSLVSNVVANFVGSASFDTFSVPIRGRREMMGLGSSAVRRMPVSFVAGLPFRITNEINLDAVASVYAVEDRVPPGWSVTEISNEGAFDPGSRSVKWGPFIDAQSRDLTYVALSPSSAQGIFRFTGTASFDGLPVTLAGQQTTDGVSVASLNRVVRSMDVSVRVGSSIWVTNQLTVVEGVSAFAIEEQLPIGWAATNINHSGAFDARQSKVKWGPYFDALSRELLYQLLPATNAQGRATISGVGSFNGEWVASTGPASVLAIANHLPVAQEDIFTRLAGQSLSLSITNLLANDSDPDGDSLEVLRLADVSEGGIPISFVDGNVQYAPANEFDKPDLFWYEVTDGFGGLARALIRVVPAVTNPALNRVSLEVLVGGSVHLRFAGIPGRQYRIQATESLITPNWMTLGSRTATARGDLDFEDSEAVFSANRFYRTIWP